MKKGISDKFSHPGGRAVEIGKDVEKNKGVRESLIKLLHAAAEELNADLAGIEAGYAPGVEKALVRGTVEAICKTYGTCRLVDAGFADEPAELERLRREFRLKTNPLLSKGHFINHARTWPKGYPGDYKIIEGMYRQMPVSEGLGRLLDLYSLNTTLAMAIRSRLREMTGILKEELSKRAGPAVLNIACGPCRELLDLVPEISASKARFICVDHDEDALRFAADRLANAGIAGTVEMRIYNALRMVSRERNMGEFGPQDIIYSIGFFDYLRDDVLVRLFASFYELLNPGGTLVAAFKDSRRYRTQDYHWIVDWAGFYQRTAEESAILFEKAGIPVKKCSRDASGVIIFYQIVRE